MSKQNFMSTNRERFASQGRQNIASQELKYEKRPLDKPRELLLPLETLGRKQWVGKPIRSQGKSSQRDPKAPIFELLNFKESLLMRNTKDGFNPIGLPRKRTHTNRMLTEKVQQATSSTEKKASVNRIIIRHGVSSKEGSPSRSNFLRQDSDKIGLKLAEAQGPFFKESPRRTFQKKLTAFEREESKQFEILYIGARRISGLQDFTDAQGDSKIAVGDAIAYQYEIVSLLGRGSFGRVFKAYDHKKKEYVALKIIKNQEKFTTQAKVEIQILQTAILNDPKLRNNIVRLKGSFVFRGHTCLKFEILSKNLYEFIKETNFSGFSLDLIRRFAIQILQALYFLAKYHIIHCDLKPENILLKQQGKSGIKVIDVGSGCFEGKQIYTYIQSRFYRAPEIVLGLQYSSAIDMWSFGCILVQLYTGLPIFPGENESEQMLMFMELIGAPPRSMLERAQRRKKFFNDDFVFKLPPTNKREKRQTLNWKAVLGSNCDIGFLDLIKRCLDWSPESRITPRQALLHEWIVAGLPHNIRAQHIEQLQER